MDSLGEHALVDPRGNPLSARIQQVLRKILPRIQSRFRVLDDDVFVAEVLEEAASRIADKEQQSGPVDNLSAYAWKTVANVARSRMRHSSMRLVRGTLGSDVSEAVFGRLRSNVGTAKQIETEIYFNQLMAQLTQEEREVMAWKRIGLSSREIAKEQGTSTARVDTLFYRIKRKLKSASQLPDASTSKRPVQPTRTRTA